jgi:DNA repair protein RAD7
LVTDTGFQAVLEALGQQLQVFTVEEANLMTETTLRNLTQYARKGRLQELRLINCKGLKEQSWRMWIPLLQDAKELCHLNTLDLSETFTDIEDPEFVALIGSLGQHLNELVVSGMERITSHSLTEGILKMCPNLSRLSLMKCKDIESLGIFKDVNGDRQYNLDTHYPQLDYLNISCCSLISDEEIAEFLSRFGHSLHSLHCNRTEFSSLSVEALSKHKFRELAELDVSWCRIIDDEVLCRLLTALPSLRYISVWGCHLVTEGVFAKKWTNALGEPIKIVGCEAECRV